MTERIRARLKAINDRTLSPAEWKARMSLAVTSEEHEQDRELIRWFRRRYTTPADRLAYARRAYARWTWIR